MRVVRAGRYVAATAALFGIGLVMIAVMLPMIFVVPVYAAFHDDNPPALPLEGTINRAAGAVICWATGQPES